MLILTNAHLEIVPFIPTARIFLELTIVLLVSLVTVAVDSQIEEDV